ncbi:hypothetical protein NUW54_g11404 [Trametes sanguinea]|uniref:Uncharacterized protein n=1 Tax=Trametes sanguinea TaxID=158606 RepID=A0ACC1NGS1_9APHY|nr:hypothetical protein NUW54_g11404 [Trametes sanguinea]
MPDNSSDEELDNEYNHLALLALAGVLAEVQDARDRRAAVRLPNRRYLRRPQALGLRVDITVEENRMQQYY